MTAAKLSNVCCSSLLYVEIKPSCLVGFDDDDTSENMTNKYRLVYLRGSHSQIFLCYFRPNVPKM